MSLRETIDIILKAEDQASRVVKQNEDAIKKFGDAAKQANDKAKNASQQFQQKTGLTGKEVNHLSEKLRQVGENGRSSFDKLSKSEQDSLVKFNMLDKSSQNLLQHVNRVGNANFSGLQGAVSDAKNKFQTLSTVTNTWGGSLDYSKSKLQLLGVNTDTLKGKIQLAGTAVTTYLGGKWDSVKSKVTSLGNHISNKLSSALSIVRRKIESIGSAFNGLGGIISSVMGGIGLSQIKDMTIGLSMNRDQVKSLTYATLGAGQATDKLWKSMDNTTTQGLVSLDELSQAMSVIKMSTGASTKQLSDMMPVVNDIGQRAILMGRSGDEAISLMQAAGKGLNGEFNMLQDNFGITKDKLKDLGWDGSAKDVEGYTEALQKYLDKGGSMEGMLNTTNGKMVTLQKNFRIAGRKLGDEFMPYLDQGLDLLNQWSDPEKGNGFAQYAIGAVAMASGFATIAPAISPTLQVIDSLSGKTRKAMQFLGLMKAEEGALTLATLRASAAQKISAATTYLSGVAHATYGAITGVLAGEIGIATAAQTIWNAVMAANPVMLVVIALAALAVAIYEAGKAFGWWKDIGSMLDAIKTNVMRLWDAFINNPNVQGLIKGIGDAWKWLQEVTKPVVDWLKGIWVEIFPESATGQWDVTRAIIEAIGFAFNMLTIPLRTVIGILQMLYPYMLQLYQTVLVPLGSFLVSVFTPVWQLLQSIWVQIAPMILSMVNAFVMFANGQMSLPGLIQNVMSNLWNIYTTILGNIVGAVVSWAGKIVSRGVNAAVRFVVGIATRIASLPGRFSSYLYSVVNRIISAGHSWVSNGVSAAGRMVSGVITNVSQLPGKVYTEFMNIGSRIMSAGGQLVQKAKEIGKSIVKGLLGAMGIHSPGIIQEKVVSEFVNMIGRVGNKVKSAHDTANELGAAIVEGFGTPTLETDVSNLLPNVDAVKTQVGVQAELSKPTVNIQSVDTNVDTSTLKESNSEIIGSFDNLAVTTGNALQTIVDKDKKAYEAIRNNDNTQLSAMTTNLQSKMSNMTNNVRTNMDAIVNKNKTGMNTVKNTTKTQLDSMVTKTKQANAKMINSWKIMQTGIVSAADRIKSDSTTHFNKLSSTIGSFYRKLQNPSGFGAGPGNGSISKGKPLRRNSSNGFKNITNAIRKAQLPQYLSLSQIKSNPLISSDNIGNYITTSGKNNKFSVPDLIRSGNIKIPIGLEDLKNRGAGWTTGVSKHVQKIKDTSKNWGMKGPKIIGKYQTSHGFKVKEFLNGTPKIDFSTFKQMAEDVFSQCHYDFYYDSNKYGSWQNAFRIGLMNCSDSSDALIAMAHSMGLPASKVHGHWGKTGHFWANVAGHKMDTTGWMNQRNWTPAASHAGPAPRGLSFGEFIDAIKSKNDSTLVVDNNSSDDDVEIKGKVTVEHIHKFIDLPEGVSAAEVARLINEAPENQNWLIKLIKLLVKEKHFQDLDLKEKIKLNKKNARAGGIISG